jgi:glycosyltransferase involved in cell wall biosynthesis
MRFLMLNWRDPKNPMAGGAERVALAYLAELVRRGHEACWFTHTFPGAQAEETIEGVHVVRGGGKGTSVLKAIKWYRTQPPFDLVLDQHHGIPWYAPWWCRTNCLAYIHEILGPIWNTFYIWPLAFIGRCQERWTLRLYREVPFCVGSESTRQALLAIGVQQAHVLPDGSDTRPLAALEPKTISEPLKLVVVSRLAPNKRVGHAILATEALVRRGVRAQLTIIGGGAEVVKLRRLVTELGLERQVQFAGLLDDATKEEALRSAHLLVHTSLREGWGLNVIEANAVGTPAVVYPVPGLVDSTLHNETGIVVSGESPAALADGVMELLRDPAKYERLRVAAWERSKTLQWDQVLPPACDWLEEQARISKR